MLKKKQKSKQVLGKHAFGHNKQKGRLQKQQKKKMIFENYQNMAIYKKYSSQNVDKTSTSETGQFLNGLSIQFPGGLSEFQYCYSMKEYLIEFIDLNKTKALVSSVIRKAASQFEMPFINFHDPVYTILKKQTKFMFNNEKQWKSGNQRQQSSSIIRQIPKQQNLIRNSKNLKKTLKKNKVQFINESFHQLKNLCQKIGIMYTNINNQKFNKFLIKQLPTVKNVKQKNDKQRKFRQNLDQNFSKIQIKSSSDKKKSPKKKSTIQKQAEDIYGLSQKKTKNKQYNLKQKNETSSKRLSERQITESSPVSQAYYTKQFNFTQFRGKIKQKHERLLTSYSSKKLKQKSSKKSNKNLQAYLKDFKRSNSQKQFLTSPKAKDFKKNKNTK